ncbi:MAG TPA: PAS domain-containing protein [Rhizomicrobium sp.]|nr:PAS domain-containing protein [Rhizomicrobium sp.]
MKHRNSHLLVGYWSRLRRGRDVPDQVDIDPRAIKRMLSHVFILDAAEPSQPHYRLAGTSLCDRYGFELKGTGYLAHWEAGSRAQMTLLLRQSLALKQPVSISAFATTTEGALLELEIVLAPISFGGTEPARFVGITQVLSDPTPLAGRPIAFQRLVASQFVREDEPLATYIPPSPPAPPAIRSLRTHPKAPHLRLVSSREKPAVSQHCDMDESMRALLVRLESVVVETPATLTKQDGLLRR